MHLSVFSLAPLCKVMACHGNAGDMATAAVRNEERRRQVFLGPLPAEFLRASEGSVGANSSPSIEADHQAALALQQQLCGATLPAATPPLTARLSVTVVQAKLVKNYGLTRMDPYVRLRVGHCIYETHTDPSGGKTPRWNKVIHCLLPPGVNSIYLEIFDECSFTMDELIAWTHITIPQPVLNGETREDWYPLTGKQGEGAEGMINLVLSYSVGPSAVSPYPPVLVVPGTGLGYAAMPVYPAPPPAAVPPPAAPTPEQTEEIVKQLAEMFPGMERAVLLSVLQANNGDREAAVNSLLRMSE